MVYRASTVKPTAEDERWNYKKVLEVAGTPWNPTPSVHAEDGARVPNPDAADADVVPRDSEMPVAVDRKMYIRKQDLVDHGVTPGLFI